MGFSSATNCSLRNNRSMQKRTRSNFKDRGRTTLPPTSCDVNRNETSYADLRAEMEINEIRIFLVIGAASVGLGILLTMWFL